MSLTSFPTHFGESASSIISPVPLPSRYYLLRVVLGPAPPGAGVDGRQQPGFGLNTATLGLPYSIRDKSSLLHNITKGELSGRGSGSYHGSKNLDDPRGHRQHRGRTDREAGAPGDR